ncbi:MAG: methyl-accepting chemotaxis protein [Spirochaetales bacterium]|nr:methyl-accepting chemotaxis protein [Spirochaetales bacterium]
MKFFQNKTISFAIPLVIILVFVLILAFTAQAFVIVKPLRHNLIESQQTDYTIITQALGELIESEINESLRLLNNGSEEIKRSLSTNSYDNNMENPPLRNTIEQTVMGLNHLNPIFLTTFFMDSEGIALSSTNKSLLGKDLSSRPYYDAIIKEGKMNYISSDALVSLSTGKTTIILASAIQIEGENQYVLATSIDLDVLGRKYIYDKNIGETGEMFVLDGQGLIIVHPNEELRYTSANALSPEYGKIVSQKEEKFFGVIKEGDQSKRAVIVPLGRTGWFFTLTININETESIVSQIRTLFYISNTILILFVSAIIVLYLKHRVVQKVKKLSGLINLASTGDLTERGLTQGYDEIADMTGHINEHLNSLSNFFTDLADNLHNLDDVGGNLASNMEETAAALVQIRTNVDVTLNKMERQRNSANSTAAAVEETERNIESLDRNIAKQNADIDEGTAAVEEMVAQINSITTSTEEADSIMSELTASSQVGLENLTDVTATVKDISDKSQALESANTLIAGISARTNLLAMNAAIEAAHAGEAGRGFAVVADEIRKLAEQSALQSSQVKQNITEIQLSIDDAVAGADSTNGSFNDIRARVEKMDQIIGEIRASMEEQAEGGSQVLNSFKELRHAGMEVKGGSAEMTKGNRIILDAMEDLIHLHDEVASAMAEIDNGMTEINKAAGAVTLLSQKNRDSIGHVREKAALYRVS